MKTKVIKLKACKCGNADLKVEAHETHSNSWIAYAYCTDCNVNPGVGLSRSKKAALIRAVKDWNRGVK